MASSVEIRKQIGPESALVVDPFYSSQGARHEARETDLFFVASRGPEVLGTVRFCEEFGTPLLRSMMVAESDRRAGVGRLLLNAFENHLKSLGDPETFCLPYAHLVGFYGLIGFELVVDESLIPQFLQDRLIEYRAKHADSGKKFVCMRRSLRRPTASTFD